MHAAGRSSTADTPSGSNSIGPGTTVTVVVQKSSNVGPIVGGVIGGLAVIGLILGAMYYFYRRGRQRGLMEATTNYQAEDAPAMEATDNGNLDIQEQAEGFTNTESSTSSNLHHFDNERLGTAKL